MEVKYKGSGYSVIVGVSSIITGLGTDSILEPSSTTIGQIVSTNIENIGVEGERTITLDARPLPGRRICLACVYVRTCLVFGRIFLYVFVLFVLFSICRVFVF